MPFWPSKRKPLPQFDPTVEQWIVRWYTIPHGWFTVGPFATYSAAASWAHNQDWAVDEFFIKRATKGSPWKSMG